MIDFKEDTKNFSGGEYSRVPLEKCKKYQIKSATNSFRNNLQVLSLVASYSEIIFAQTLYMVDINLN